MKTEFNSEEYLLMVDEIKKLSIPIHEIFREFLIISANLSKPLIVNIVRNVIMDLCVSSINAFYEDKKEGIRYFLSPMVELVNTNIEKMTDKNLH